MSELIAMNCTDGAPALNPEEIKKHLSTVSGWQQDGKAIRKAYGFKNYYETMAFVNAVAWVAHKENHHPDLEVGYNKCSVRYSTHSAGGLSVNDFICAAKIERLISR